MKVLQFITALGDGGAETLVKDYAMLLNRNEFEVKVVTRDINKNTANYRRLKQADVEVITLCENISFIGRIIRRVSLKRYYAYKLDKVIKQEKPDIIHVHLQLLKIVASLKKRTLEGIKIYYTCHSLPKVMLGEKQCSEYEAAKKLIKNKNLNLIALHNGMAKELNEMFDIKDTIVLPNGIDVLRFAIVRESKSEIRRSLGIPDSAFVIGHIGRFTYAKNHEFLIQVFEHIFQIRKDAYLLLVGSGQMKDKIEEMLSEKELKDYVKILSNRTDTERLYKAMDVFAFPSIFEGFPVVVVEAQASRLPCVLSDCIIKDLAINPNVIFKPIDDVILWRDEVIKAAEYKKEFDLSAIERFDMRNKIVKKLELIYRSGG